MMRIRNLSGISYDAMERAMFRNQLPAEVRTALASSKAMSNDELVSEADAVMEEFKIAKRTASTPRAVTAVAFQEVDAVARPFRPSSSFSARGALCYLHRKFGAQAYACRSDYCPMKDKVRPPPQGNGRAGR